MSDATAGPPKSLPTILLREPYRPRRVRFLELWRPGGWLVKLYSIAYKGQAPGPATLEAAKRAASPNRPAATIAMASPSSSSTGARMPAGC